MDRKEREATPLDKILGDRLRELRAEHGLTQREVMARTGLNKTKVTRYENGKTEVDLATLLRFGAAVGMTIEEILGPILPELKKQAGVIEAQLPASDEEAPDA